jgi:hypothetical protein
MTPAVFLYQRCVKPPHVIKFELVFHFASPTGGGRMYDGDKLNTSGEAPTPCERINRVTRNVN